MANHIPRSEQCPLRALPLFVPHTAQELALVQSLKRSELVLEADTELIHVGRTDGPLYTLLAGWAFRFKTLSDGRRQILNFLLPGHFIGVQQKMEDGAAHGVVTLTTARFCVFKHDALWELHRREPSMGFNVTWLTAHEESLVDDNLLSIGRRSAEERVATLLIQLYKRTAAVQAPRGRVRRAVSANAAAYCGRARPVAGAHQQDAEQAGAARFLSH